MPKPKSRGNGQGSAYRRGTSWTASVVVGYRLPSKEGAQPIPIKRTKAGFATKKEALAYCPFLLAGGAPKKPVAPRLFEYWETYENGEFAALSRSKQTAYRIAWKKLKALHDVRVDCITVDLLRKTVSDACPTFDPAKDCKSVLSNLFALAAADRFVDKDLPSFIVLPKHEEKERMPFSDTEQAALWKLYESGDRRAAIPLLMIYTGMMPGEAQQLRVEHIDLVARTITHAGLKTKVRKATPIVIASAILPLVEDLIANAQPSGYIWKRNEEEWYASYYAALESAGCRRLTPYSCRHTTATALAITEGIAPQTIKRVMRWSTTKMLDRYAHPGMSDALTAVDALKKAGE
jgi:integrase